MGIDGLGVRRGRAHFLAALPLRRRRHIAIEARHPRDDDLVTIGLVHAIAQLAADGADGETGKRKESETGNRRPF
jgi:hypothetical protein